jgi:AcrR family transcriptional regulator
MSTKAAFSPRKRPKQARSRSLVGSVVTATIRILRTSGFDRSTMVRIAEVAGVSVGSLYQYFPNKETLVAEVIHSEVNLLVRMIEEKAGGMGSEKIDRVVDVLVRTVLEFFVQEKKLHKAISGPILSLGQVETVIAGRRRVGELIERLLKERGSEVEIRDCYLAAYTIINVLMGVVEAILYDEMSEAFQENLIQESQRIVRNYLKIRY